jgi:hypothetical protein
MNLLSAVCIGHRNINIPYQVYHVKIVTVFLTCLETIQCCELLHTKALVTPLNSFVYIFVSKLIIIISTNCTRQLAERFQILEMDLAEVVEL